MCMCVWMILEGKADDARGLGSRVWEEVGWF